MPLNIDSFETFRKVYSVVDSGTIDEVGETLSQHVTAYDAVPVGNAKGTIDAQIACATKQDISLVYLDWGAPMIGSSLAKEEEFNIRLTLKGTASTTDPYFGEISAERERNHARIFSLIEDTKTYSYGHVGLNLVVPHKMLEERIKTFYQDEISQPLRFAPLLNLSTMAGKSIVTMIDYLKTQYTEAPEILDDPMVGTSFKELMIAAILGGMEHNYRDFHNTGVRDVATPHRVVLAEEYMKAHANEPVTVRVLAEQAACSERSLHNGFRKFRNKSPLTVLRDIRLENAHKDLVRGEASVTHTAFKWGFSNVGRFAKIYFLRFGEKPSQTLGSSSHKLKTAKY